MTARDRSAPAPSSDRETPGPHAYEPPRILRKRDVAATTRSTFSGAADPKKQGPFDGLGG